MQDKEFDQLFNSKLGNLELEPSPMVWDNIAGGLQQKRRKLWPYFSIAASVVILASAGLLFIRKAGDDTVKSVKRDRVLVKTNKPKAPANIAKSNEGALPADNIVTSNKPAKKYVTFVTYKFIAVKKPSQKIIKENNGAPLVDLAPTDPGPMVAVIAPIQIPNVQVPDKETPFTAMTNNSREVVEKTVTTEDTENAPVKKRGIHSLGGLLGAIVAKIDKREDKLIEFTENDENRSTITGLNLGFIKIKKK